MNVYVVKGQGTIIFDGLLRMWLSDSVVRPERNTKAPWSKGWLHFHLKKKNHCQETQKSGSNGNLKISIFMKFPFKK